MRLTISHWCCRKMTKMVAYYIALCLLVLLGSSLAEDEKCSRIGLVCSSDCNKMILCTGIGADPLAEVVCNDRNEADVTKRSYCRETESGAECGATLPKCGGSEGSVKVSCGALGRFPHPTIPSASITCPEPNKSPSATCYCKIGEEVDRTDLNLQCIKQAAEPPPKADCTDLFEFKPLGDDSNYNYFCADTTDIWMSFKANGKTTRSSLAKNTRSLGTCEPTSSNGDSGGNTNEPPTTLPSTSPPVTTKPPPVTTKPPPVTTKPPPVTTQPPPTTQRPTDPPNTIRCTKKGEVIADETNCRKYHFCDKNLQPQPRNCPAGKWFSKNVKTCIDGNCP